MPKFAGSNSGRRFCGTVSMLRQNYPSLVAIVPASLGKKEKEKKKRLKKGYGSPSV